jgi:uncharacterized membrane protein YbhN (UPF0104 family)
MMPGGLLAAEVSIVGVLVQLGATPAVASGTAVISRISTLWFGVFIGFIAMFLSSKVNLFSVIAQEAADGKEGNQSVF